MWKFIPQSPSKLSILHWTWLYTQKFLFPNTQMLNLGISKMCFITRMRAWTEDFFIFYSWDWNKLDFGKGNMIRVLPDLLQLSIPYSMYLHMHSFIKHLGSTIVKLNNRMRVIQLSRFNYLLLPLFNFFIASQPNNTQYTRIGTTPNEFMWMTKKCI